MTSKEATLKFVPRDDDRLKWRPLDDDGSEIIKTLKQCLHPHKGHIGKMHWDEEGNRHECIMHFYHPKNLSDIIVTMEKYFPGEFFYWE